MNKILPLMKSAQLLGASALSMLMSTNMMAANATYTSGAVGNWNVPGNWSGGTGATGLPGGADVAIVNGTDTTVTFDGDTWQYLIDNSLLTSGSSGEYRIQLYRQGTAAGTNTVTFDYGNSNTIRTTGTSAQFVGSASGSNGSLNHVSGNTIFETNTFYLGEKSGSSGTLNITGGSVTIQRENSGNSISIGTAGTGMLQISAGSFFTRAGATLGANGTFSVLGSGVTEIGIGGSGSVDGSWTQNAGGILDVGVDTGLSTIVIHDEGGSGTSATFDAGSLLDVSFLNSTIAGSWTVMMVENGDIIDNGLAFAAGVDTGTWSFNIDNSGANGILTITSIPEPSAYSFLAGAVVIGLIALRRRKA